MKIASLQSQFMVLDEALKTTNRRVNALEFIQIPKIIATIAWIESELDEESREDFFRLKKVQDKKKELKAAAQHGKGEHMIETGFEDEGEQDVMFGLGDTAGEMGEEDEDVFV